LPSSAGPEIVSPVALVESSGNGASPPTTDRVFPGGTARELPAMEIRTGVGAKNPKSVGSTESSLTCSPLVLRENAFPTPNPMESAVLT
jgi:hypothetical protein